MLKRLIPTAALAVALSVSGMPSAEAISVNDILRGAAIAAQGFFISEADEIALGKATAAKVMQQMPRTKDAALEAYVTRVGKAVAAQSDRPNLPYQFFVLETNELNAFAAPGGFIFVTTGLLRFMGEEAQLAGVLGHEVAHVAKKHSVKAIRKAMVAQGVATAALGDNPSQLTAIGANIAATLILKGFDRKAELEADQVGAGYSFRAGYDPKSLVRFLDALGKASGEPPDWLMAVADHPKSADRVVRLNQHLTSPTFRTTRQLATNREVYQREVRARLGPAPAKAS